MIVGMGRSGLAAAKLLASLKATVAITEREDSVKNRQQAALLRQQGVFVELGGHSEKLVSGKDLVVVSPGVENSCPIFDWAQRLSIPVVSEVEVASLLCPATILAVTGSSGKTTVTTLLGEVFQAAGKKTFVLGNIGTPFSSAIQDIEDQDIVCLEVSSFQLERTISFKPKVALMLNFNRNHLDRHKDMQEYLDAKKRIFRNQDQDDYLVLNGEDPILKNLEKEAKAKTIFFYAHDRYDPNQAAVLKVASIFGIEEKICRKVFNNFKGLKNRLEFVGQIRGVTFINDSKATLVESTLWAIKKINQPIILIAGGRDKGVDYSTIIGPAKGKVKEIIAIGEAKAKIGQALRGEFSFSEAETLKEAVELAFKKSQAGDCILLSPMCSSFDMFRDYEQRGEAFKEIVRGLMQTL